MGIEEKYIKEDMRGKISGSYPIKSNVQISTSDFWYDIAYGGYIKPRKILLLHDDAVKVEKAVEILKKFYSSCEEQIEGFVQ